MRPLLDAAMASFQMVIHRAVGAMAHGGGTGGINRDEDPAAGLPFSSLAPGMLVKERPRKIPGLGGYQSLVEVPGKSHSCHVRAEAQERHTTEVALLRGRR